MRDACYRHRSNRQRTDLVSTEANTIVLLRTQIAIDGLGRQALAPYY
jgi:hypothetical protein